MALTKATPNTVIQSAVFNNNTYNLWKGVAGFEDTVALGAASQATFAITPNSAASPGVQLFQVNSSAGVLQFGVTATGGIIGNGTASFAEVFATSKLTYGGATASVNGINVASSANIQSLAVPAGGIITFSALASMTSLVTASMTVASGAEIDGMAFLNGGVRLHRIAISNINYTPASGDFFISYETSLTASRTIFLQATMPPGQAYIIKDAIGLSGTYALTLSPNSANIDGVSTKGITSNYGVMRVYTDGANWFTW